MPTKDREAKKPRRNVPEHHPEPDPEHPMDWGGDMQQDDADVRHDGGRKGGRGDEDLTEDAPRRR